VQSLRTHLLERRKFLLEQDELKPLAQQPKAQEQKP
jgi:hypothetical protein